MTNQTKLDRLWIPTRECFCTDVNCRKRPVDEPCPSIESNKKGVQLFKSVMRSSAEAKEYVAFKNDFFKAGLVA